ncbi:sensor domain-containing diguanylate cyclase [Natronospira bacteriovora]|uniref:diguanylate cyclase n=1 Tax=Natronospira bacteriovora TaxID=3069753 RepID=A0ABU0W7I2_9GAMM|nr:GGDEF domain-containing protein [Natronospira sp. AB-CW4]MDQ2068970.1 diguanylate cyclase [Natronospira sp. AB-CW4]
MSGPEQSESIHRIARINYLPRALGFGSTFVAILLLTAEREFGTTTLLLAVATFILYPHLAFAHARLARDSKSAEQKNLLADSIMLGVWSAALGFTLWITFALLLATLLNNAINGGPARLGLAAICFLAGALLWVLFGGFQFEPHASLMVTLYMASASLLYILGVGITYYRQNTKLARAHRAIEQNNEVFRSLLEYASISNETGTVKELIERTLEHFRRLQSGHPFGLLLFDRGRPRFLLHAVFRGVPEHLQESMIRRLTAHNASNDRGQPLVLEGLPRPLLALPMHEYMDQASGYLVMDRKRAEFLGRILTLFVDQLASALQNKLLTEELRKAAETDALTGLYNRGYLEEQLNDAMERKRSHDAADFSVIMLDVIGLKQANDRLGHEAGDELIRTVARRLRRHARKSDVVARFGGDEFVVLCHDCREADAMRAVERLMGACQESSGRIRLGNGRQSELPVEISVGVAGSDQHPPNRVMPEADARMYAHKEAFYARHHRSRDGADKDVND